MSGFVHMAMLAAFCLCQTPASEPAEFVLLIDTVPFVTPPTSMTVPAGQCVEVQAPQAPFGQSGGMVFDRWTGDALGREDPITVCMDRDKAITANYLYADCPCGCGVVGMGTPGIMPLMLVGFALMKVRYARYPGHNRATGTADRNITNKADRT